MSGYSGSVSMTGTASAGGAEFNVQLSLTLSVSSLTDNSGQLTGTETVSGDFISNSTEGGSDSGDASLVDNPLSITGPYPDGPFTYLSGAPIEFYLQQSSDVIYPQPYNGINDYVWYVDVTLTESYDPTSNLITGTANAVFIDGVGTVGIGSVSANFQLSTAQPPPIVVSIQTGTSTISSGNTTSVGFDVHLSAPASQDVTVKLAPDMSSTDPNVLNDAGAFAVDSQYLTDWSVSGGLQVTIPAGAQDQTVTVNVNSNASADPKTAYFTLGIDPTSVPSGITVDPNHGVAVGTIQQTSSDPVKAVITGDNSSFYKDYQTLLDQDIQAALDRVYGVIPGEKNTTIKIQVKFTSIAPLLAAAAPILTNIPYAAYKLLSPTAAIPSGSGGLAVQVPLTLLDYVRGTDSSASDIYLQIDTSKFANWYNGDIDISNQTADNSLNHDSRDAVRILTHELLHGFDFGSTIPELSGTLRTPANAWATHVGLVGSTYYYFLPTPQAVALSNGPTDPAPEHVADPSDIMYYKYNGDEAISSSDAAILQNFGYSPFSLKVQTPAQGSSSLTVDHSFAYTDTGDGNLTIVGSGQGDIIALGAGNDAVMESSGNNNIFVWNQAAAGSDTVDLGSGNNVVILGVGEHNVVALSGDRGIYAVTRSGATVTVSNGPAGTDTLMDAELLQFADGTMPLDVTEDFLDTGTSDVLYRNASTGDTWFEAMSNGALNGWTQIGGSDTHYSVVGLGDFYGNGYSDTLYRNASTGDTWIEVISNGAFASWKQVGGSDTHYAVVGIGDLYGNGTDDILFRNISTGDTWIEAISNGAFAGWHQIGGSDTHYTVVGVGDFYGNGTDDILFRNSATGDTWIEQISNGQLENWRQVGGSDTHYTVVGVGDFYGNGTDDILFRNSSTGDTWIEQISNGQLENWREVGGSSTTYAVVGVGDYIGNGTSDILFRNNSTGDSWFEAISNGASAGWKQIGGSNPSYTVPDTGTPPTSPPPPPTTTTYTYNGPAFNYTSQGAPPGAGSDLTGSVTFDFDTSNATGWYGSPATIGTQYLTGLVSGSITALSMQSGSYSATLYSNGVLSPGDTLSQGGPDFHLQNGVIDQWFINFETPSSTTFLTEKWPVETEDSLFIPGHGTGEVGNLGGAWTKQ